MPIYEYQSIDPDSACSNCRDGFEAIQGMDEKPMSSCPDCGKKVKKIISWCHSAVMEASEKTTRIENKIKNYEKEGKWSHAAELADTHSEKTKDTDLKIRALDNYKKAGYGTDMLDKHAKNTD